MNKVNSISLLRLTSVLALLTLPLSSTHAADYYSARSSGLAGSGIAGPLLNDSLYLNPSFSAFLPTYAAGLSYSTYGAKTDGIHGRNYSISVLDGRNQIFQAGVAYTVREDHSFIHLGTSKSFIQNWGLGLSAKLFFDSTKKNAGQELAFSSTYVFSPWIQSALVVDNLFQSDKSRGAGLYREFVVGAKFNIDKILLLYFDPRYVPDYAGDKAGYSAGVEFVMMTDLFLRIGKAKNAQVPQLNIRGDGYGIGLGWVAPRVSLDYGLAKTTDPLNVTTHVISATSFF